MVVDEPAVHCRRTRANASGASRGALRALQRNAQKTAEGAETTDEIQWVVSAVSVVSSFEIRACRSPGPWSRRDSCPREYLSPLTHQIPPFIRSMLDFYNIDSVLTEEERAVRDSVRRFVDERVLPIIGDAYVEGRFPKELIPE